MVPVKFIIRLEYTANEDELFLFGDGHELGEWNIQKSLISNFEMNTYIAFLREVRNIREIDVCAFRPHFR